MNRLRSEFVRIYIRFTGRMESWMGGDKGFDTFPSRKRSRVLIHMGICYILGFVPVGGFVCSNAFGLDTNLG